jgi:hypothetical protein
MSEKVSMPYKEYTQEERDLLRRTASDDRAVASSAMKAVAQAFVGPLKKAVFDEDTLGDIFAREEIGSGDAKYPLDFIAPGTEDDFVAFTMPKQGRVPERHIEGDELFVQTFKIANAIDWDLDYAKDARWDIIARAMDAFRSGFTKRNNDDGWHVVTALANSAGYMVRDTAAAAGKFTPKLIYRMKTTQKRRTRNGTLTDLHISVEAMEDIRDWSTTDVSDMIRERLFLAENDPAMVRIAGVNLHELRELGEGSGGTAEEYQQYFVSTLGGTLGAGSDVELVIGLDLSKRDSFIQPIRSALEIFDAGEVLHRQRPSVGVYGWMRHGFAGVDNRRAILGSF